MLEKKNDEGKEFIEGEGNSGNYTTTTYLKLVLKLNYLN